LGLRLLVVSADDILTATVRAMLEDLGHAVAAIAGSEAEAAVAMMPAGAASRPDLDLLLMDVRLGGGDGGIDAARHLAGAFGVRSLFLSPCAGHQLMARITESYPLGVVHTPVSPIRLKTALDLAARRLRSCGRPDRPLPAGPATPVIPG
jgi:CheY-like chemotaxis protein